MARVVELPDPTDHEPIEGPRLRLRPLTPDDLPLLMRWLADPEVQAFYGRPPKSVAEAHDSYLVAEDAPCWRFVIEAQGRAVGEIQYYHPYLNERWSAGIDIFIGEPGDRNRGLGTEAVRTLLQHLFEVKGVNRVTIGPEPANRRAIRSYEKTGFQPDGVIRRSYQVDDRWVDAVHMTILDDEWPAARARWEREADEPRRG
ncbi:MAG: GNAT family protein [Chloroflexi bacterium]|nr:GNAT family protein [Chloroflexota bacterium]